MGLSGSRFLSVHPSSSWEVSQMCIRDSSCIVPASLLGGLLPDIFQIVEQVHSGLVRVLESVRVVLHLDDPPRCV